MKRNVILILAAIAMIGGCVESAIQPGPDGTSEGFLPGNDIWVHMFPNYGRSVKIFEHKNVGQVPFSSLLSFLKADAVNNTGECNATGNNCIDFAARLHNNAEARGINCSIVTFWYRNNEGRECDHAINAFLTTDRGMVLVDANSMDERFVFLNLSTREYGSGKLGSVASAADYDNCRCTGNYRAEGKVIGGLSFMRESSAGEARKQMHAWRNEARWGW